MSFHLLSLPAADAERLAYAEGFTDTAQLFARLADMQKALGDATAEIVSLRKVLNNLAQQVREDIPQEQGSRHLWDAVEDAEQLT